jgi:hypothetical protein
MLVPLTHTLHIRLAAIEDVLSIAEPELVFIIIVIINNNNNNMMAVIQKHAHEACQLRCSVCGSVKLLCCCSQQGCKCM